ncbi:MAG: NUDIX domain-containing protein [Phormidium sp. BM_Day4_Bin.17]|nr:NUDIX domain-containing protein [Phormidium sp. BM_Day4_Bin.17]UCJ13751.1 MAG: NUDIX domain-containing protein [Phormidium sp. PBR-2020]
MTKPWTTLAQLFEMRSPWLTLIGERLQDDRDRLLDYWRVEKADSAVIVTQARGQFLLPPPSYRPGIAQASLDFPGGRIPPDTSPQAAAQAIVSRELNLVPEQILDLTPLNDQGWPINSSFSNQRLFGFMAEVDLQPETLSRDLLTYPCSEAGIAALLTELTCLQCRAVLLEWLH